MQTHYQTVRFNRVNFQYIIKSCDSIALKTNSIKSHNLKECSHKKKMRAHALKNNCIYKYFRYVYYRL